MTARTNGAGPLAARIVELNGQGLTHSQIAERLGVSLSTITRALAAARKVRTETLE